MSETTIFECEYGKAVAYDPPTIFNQEFGIEVPRELYRTLFTLELVAKFHRLQVENARLQTLLSTSHDVTSALSVLAAEGRVAELEAANAVIDRRLAIARECLRKIWQVFDARGISMGRNREAVWLETAMDMIPFDGRHSALADSDIEAFDELARNERHLVTKEKMALWDAESGQYPSVENKPCESCGCKNGAHLNSCEVIGDDMRPVDY